MNALEDTTTRMELKYCEACGALRVRSEDDRSVYCPRCAKVLRHVAGPKAARPKAARPKPRREA